MFLHDVALTLDVSEPRYVGGYGTGGHRVGGQMRYAIFDTAPEAEQFAARNRHRAPLVSHRDWHRDIFHASRIDDHRGESTRGTC